MTNTYLGYSVEDSCMKQPFIPHTERPRGRVYAMAKSMSYFAAQPDRAWPVTFFSNARKKIQTPGGVSFVLGAHNDTDFAKEYGLSIPDMPSDGSVENLGLMDTETFMEEVARSRVLLGVGRPAISPTPYQGLCLAQWVCHSSIPSSRFVSSFLLSRCARSRSDSSTTTTVVGSEESRLPRCMGHTT